VKAETIKRQSYPKLSIVSEHTTGSAVSHIRLS